MHKDQHSLKDNEAFCRTNRNDGHEWASLLLYAETLLVLEVALLGHSNLNNFAEINTLGLDSILPNKIETLTSSNKILKLPRGHPQVLRIPS